MKQQSGFTVIEVIVAIAFIALAGTVFFWQKSDLEVAARDAERKTAINAMYYSLEKVYFAQNNSYPSSISADNLQSMDPELFIDPNGLAVGEQASDYRYEASGCEENVCQSYTLRANLEHEAAYVKNSDN